MIHLLFAAAMLTASGDPRRIPVTFDMRDAPLVELMTIFERIGCRRIVVTPPVRKGDRVASLQVTDQPFARVLDALLGPRGYKWGLRPPTLCLKHPGYGARLSVPGPEISFEWTRDVDADSYRFVVARTRDLSRPVVLRTVKAPSAVIVELEPGMYYWRVDALDTSGEVLFRSETRRFDVRVTPR